jgi:hypothetical protein
MSATVGASVATAARTAGTVESVFARSRTEARAALTSLSS